MLYTKRAAAYISLRQQAQALRDLNKAVELDPSYVQVRSTAAGAQGMWQGAKGCSRGGPRG